MIERTTRHSITGMLWMTLLAAVMLPGCATSDSRRSFEAKSDADQFFLTMRQYLGNRYPGVVDEQYTPDNPFGEAPLEIVFAVATYDEIRVPFSVGEDRSRTWIIRRHDDGLELRHDHRMPDGSPDELTNYGGFSTDDGTASRQHFPADQITSTLLPEAATNVWTLKLRPQEQTLIYNLTRHDRPRFRAVFDLSRPLRD